MMTSKKKQISCILVMALMLFGCVQKPVQPQSIQESSPQRVLPVSESTTPQTNSDFTAILEEAKGTSVSFYGWGGDDKLNTWLDTVFAPHMKEKYSIEMDRVPMDIDQVLSKLSGEIQAGKKEGSIDLIWINGENFYTAKENNLLYGSFTEMLPNYTKNLDVTSVENLYDFSVPIEGYEAPYGRAQLVLINDSARTAETPSDAQAFLEFAKKYPGQVTYPAPPDFTGSAFVRNIIYELVGNKQFVAMETNKETLRRELAPAFDYLRELNPYLWNEGKSFPATSAQMDQMFMDGEVVFSVSYDPYSVSTNIEKGIYPKTARSFVFERGTVGNTNFIAIANNSSNREGALVAMNEMLSAEMQASRYEKLKILPVLDYQKLSAEEKQLFNAVKIGEGSIPQEELLKKRLPEMPAKLVPIIEELWLEEVADK